MDLWPGKIQKQGIESGAPGKILTKISDLEALSNILKLSNHQDSHNLNKNLKTHKIIEITVRGRSHITLSRRGEGGFPNDYA